MTQLTKTLLSLTKIQEDRKLGFWAALRNEAVVAQEETWQAMQMAHFNP